MKKLLLVQLSFLLVGTTFGQTKPAFSIGGTLGVSYEGYGLDVKPTGSNIYTPRRPWNQVRFNFNPVFQFSKNFSLPVNFNFAALPTNFAGPYSGFTPGAPAQTFGQWLTNPMNNFGLNPKYKWAEFQLGTQYLKYSDLSTGDIGIFGAGFNLRPGKYIVQFFTGTSQQGINYVAPPPAPGITGAFRRTHWMAQIGKEKEGMYKATFNFSKSVDKIASLTTPPLTIKPQENFVMSITADKYFDNWYVKTELAQSFYTADKYQPLDATALITYKPFMDARIGSTRDFAGFAAVGRKSKNFDFGVMFKQIGGGFRTNGYPFNQTDYRDITVNTRIAAWKDKMNINATLGQRTNNISNTSLKSDQFIANINWFTQFNDKWSLNMTYNNFGFQTGVFSGFGVKNVSNDLSINPTYTWSNTKMSNVLSLNYSYSKYKETLLVPPFTTTDNNTHTALLSYIPVYFNRQITPDFSILYFSNTAPGLKMSLVTLSSGLGIPMAKNKIQLKGQLQYTIGKLNSFSSNNNLIASVSFDWRMNKKLTWNTFMSSNYYKYGDELSPPPSLIGANYLESNLRTGLQYRF